MINVSRVLNSPRMTQVFTVYRKSGSFVNGDWTPGENPIQVRGVATVADATDIEQLPEGDMQSGVMAFRSPTQLVVTNQSGTSDEILWRGVRWRAAKVFPYADYGYYKVLAVKMDPTAEVTP